MILVVFRCSQLFSDVLSCFLMFSAALQLLCITTPCADIFSQDDVRCFQMFQRCFQMFSAVFRYSQLLSDVLRMPSIDHRYSPTPLFQIHITSRQSKIVQDSARQCKIVQDSARQCSIVQDYANEYKIMQYHAIPCNTLQYRAIPCNTMQYHAMPCNTMQYPA